jgi:glycosyltransferase involved in cell wall biosynthesis
MNVLFLSLSKAVSDISNKGIYPDLLRKFHKEGHTIYIVCPFERRTNMNTSISQESNIHILGVKTLNLTKSNLLEKGLGMIMLEYQFKNAIRRYLSSIKIDLLIYSTPPITFNSVIGYLKQKNNLISYLLLKDIFPQNAVDLNILTKFNPLYWFFRNKEKKLYRISDYIGCMSEANVNYLLKENPWISKKKVEICPNSIELSHWTEIVGVSDIYLRYQIPPEAFILMFGGNLGKPQGIDFLIKVLLSNATRKDIFFIIAGNGTEYNKLAKSISRINNVRLLPMLPQSEYDILLQVSHVGLIFLDRRFTIPNFPSRLLSYLERKKPVLMAIDSNTDIGVIAEKNNFGFWVESGDVDLFNKRLNDFVSDRMKAKVMGENGYLFLKENYTVDNSYKIIMSHLI